jgi:hypothetical protein
MAPTSPAWLVIGQVVAVHIDKHLLVDGVYDTAAAHPILRAGGPTAYAEISPESMFGMTRPGDRRVARQTSGARISSASKQVWSPVWHAAPT